MMFQEVFKIFKIFIKHLEKKFKNYKVFIGENQLTILILVPFITSYIISLPFKIVINILLVIVQILRFILKLPQKIYHYFLSLFSLGESNFKQIAQRSSLNKSGISSKKQINQINSYFEIKKLSQNHFNLFSPIEPQDNDRIKFSQVFRKYKESHTFDLKELKLEKQQSRAIGVMLGMAINDALGASTEFLTFQKQGHKLIKNGFEDIRKAISQNKLKPRHGQIGIWTDDASMGMVMAYGLMINNYQFDPIKNREMFHLWWYHGLGNGGRKHSVGLGGNISISIEQFNRNPKQSYTSKGTQDNNGNGSLMRLAPIPIVFHDNIKEASKVATLQSLTTHNGLQAKQCSRLMTEIIISLIKREQNEDWRGVLIKTCDGFTSKVESVEYLAKGNKQTQMMAKTQYYEYPSFRNFNKTLFDRNWNWRQPNFTYSPTRLSQNPKYIGSYCMDALAMALHVVYYNDSFKQIAVKIADQGGDCDTVGAIAGQIAGAIYGVNEEVLQLYSEMEDFKSGRYEAFLIGHSLYHKKSLYDQQKKIVQQQPIINRVQQKEMIMNGIV